jgi:GNAT superfamily N-acetyltransferase
VSALPADDRGWFDLVRSNQPPLWALMTDAVGGEVLREGEVQASIVPASPNRSFFNSVWYEGTDHLLEVLPHLAEVYDEAGVNAWTVWIPATDETAKAGLEAAGHVLDATPRAMGFELSDLNLPEDDPALEFRAEKDMELIRWINEVAYGYPPGDFPPMAEIPDTEVYLADLDGQTVGATMLWTPADDTEITFVAVLPEARGRGISGRLLGHALKEARAGGTKASTLIATKLGRPVYERLGYRDVGGFEMWERRKG